MPSQVEGLRGAVMEAIAAPPLRSIPLVRSRAKSEIWVRFEESGVSQLAVRRYQVLL